MKKRNFNRFHKSSRSNDKNRCFNTSVIKDLGLHEVPILDIENCKEYQLWKHIKCCIDELVTSISVPRNNKLEVFFAAQLLRSRALFDAVLLLSTFGLPNAAATLLRSLLEMQFVTEAIGKDHNYFQFLVDSEEDSRFKALNKLKIIPDNERADHLTAERIDCLQSTLKQGKEMKMIQWAQLANRDNEYLTAYSLLSKQTHPSLSATEEHLIFNENQDVIGLTAWLGTADAPDHITSACEFMINILAVMPAKWISDDLAQKLNVARRRTNDLMAKHLNNLRNT